MVDKEKAIQLRKQGKKYSEIATLLNCSVDWCKKNLKGIKKEVTIKETLPSDKFRHTVIVSDGLVFPARINCNTGEIKRTYYKHQSEEIKAISLPISFDVMKLSVLPNWLSDNEFSVAVDNLVEVSSPVFESFDTYEDLLSSSKAWSIDNILTGVCLLGNHNPLSKLIIFNIMKTAYCPSAEWIAKAFNMEVKQAYRYSLAVRIATNQILSLVNSNCM